MKRLLFLRGSPGSGKQTVGKIVSELLQWEMLWFHDLYRLPDPDPVVIATIVLPGLAMRLQSGKDLVFVRPARLRSTVEEVINLATHCGYSSMVVRLTASRAKLVSRVMEREKFPWRVSDSKGLDKYLANGGAEDYPGESIIETDNLTPEEVASFIERLVRE